MEMLDYCKTFTMIKESYNNGENADNISQEALTEGSGPSRRASRENGCNTSDMLCPIPVLSNSLSGDVQTLSPLKDVGKAKLLISPSKTPQRISFESELTFQPKLNAMSLKLAKERGPERLRSVMERRAAALYAETESNFTFKPKVSSKSVRIVQNLKSTFMDRQNKHVEKQKQFIEGMINSYQGKGKLSPVGAMKTQHRLGKLQTSKDMQHSRHSTLHETETRRNSKSDVPRARSESSGIESDTSKSPTKSQGDSPLKSSSSNSINSTKLSERSPTICPLKKSEKELYESSPYNQSLAMLNPYNHSVEQLTLKRQQRQPHRNHKRHMTHPLPKCKTRNHRDEWNDSTKCEADANHARTHSDAGRSRWGKLKYNDPLFEKVRHAKQVAELAIKNKKVFLCNGRYPIIRAVLRRRGWVEKHFKGHPVSGNKKEDDDSGHNSSDTDNDTDNEGTGSADSSPRGKENRHKPSAKTAARRSAIKSKKSKDDSSSSSSDDSDVDGTYDEGDWNAGCETGPDSEFSLMSRVVRNAVSMLIWTTKRDDIDFKFLRKEQMVNHYCKSHSFTTKVGLCSNLKNLWWYEDADPRFFFPRCHVLGSDDEIMDFIDDFRLSSAVSIVKWVVHRYGDGNALQRGSEQEQNGHDVAVRANESGSCGTPSRVSSAVRSSTPSPGGASSGNSNVVPVRALTLALDACRHYLRSKENLDIDENKESGITKEMWELIVENFYQVVHQGAVIASGHTFLRECQNVLEQLRVRLPQLDIDGMKNVWIVKPGAKSRGRGISCVHKLEDILKLAGTTVGRKEGKWVAQKYVERPLLIYGVKFDIRQWFLVTDWNPLTLWFYQDCYLRFCSQNFSLDNYHVSIHLANNAIQKNFENGVRDKRLPEENMWTSDDFKDYLKKRDVGHVWSELIYPGMKQAVIYALESCQEIVECRKNSFELYGADFLVDENFRPWLVEINSSPSMGPSTAVTRKLCAQALEDTMKVVLDRREDKTCDTGRFELAWKLPHLCSPPYIGINLSVDGQAVKRPAIIRRAVTSAKMTSLTRPKESKNTLPSCPGGQDPTTAETSGGVKREANAKDKEETKRRPKRAEGSWAAGCVCTAGQAIPLATAFGTSDENKLRGLVPSDACKEPCQPERRSPRALAIPKAVLRYSNDAGMHPRTQLPISIGPDNTVRHF